MIETLHIKFQLIQFAGRGGHAILNFEFSSKNTDFLPILALIYLVKIPGIVAFFDLILLKLHIKPSLNQFVVFFFVNLSTKKLPVFSKF